MMDFRHLMVKGLELKKNVKGASEKCVIYMDVTCRTFFCAKQKNAANAKAYRVEDISEAHASGDNEKIISIAHKDGSLDLEVSSPKVRERVCSEASGIVLCARSHLRVFNEKEFGIRCRRSGKLSLIIFYFYSTPAFLLMLTTEFYAFISPNP